MIPFIDLAAQRRRLKSRIDEAVARVLDDGLYIMGPDVDELEAELAAFCGARHVISCANGTDALLLSLRALGVGEGDAVFAPTFTFAATAEVVPLARATPVFVDSEPRTFNMDVESLKRSIVAAREMGLKPRAVIPVDLFGLPADLAAIEPVAAAEGMDIVCDAAQSFGAQIGEQRTGRFGRVTTTSFFPSKPLGCYGDGGAVITDDPALAALVDSLRVHGKGEDKYDNVRLGANSRLDTIQAAILRVKLSVYTDEMETRDSSASRYEERLANLVETPFIPDGFGSVWAEYTIKLRSAEERAHVRKAMSEAGVPTAIYYARPLHRQSVYRSFPTDPAGLPVAEELSGRVLSLPMHAYLDESTQDMVIEALETAVRSARR